MTLYPTLRAVDDGHAEIKLTMFNDKDTITPIVFRSRVVAFDQSKDLGNTVNPMTYETAGCRFTVDGQGHALDTRIPNYPLSDVNRVLIHHGLRKANGTQNEIILAVSLPVEKFFNINIQHFQAQKLASLNASLVHLASGTELGGRVSGVYVYPEALSCFFDETMNDKGEFTQKLPTGPWAIIDIGGRTSDLIVASFNARHQSIKTVDLGVLQVIDHVESSLCQKFDAYPSELPDLSNVLRNPIVPIGNCLEDCSALVHEGKRILANEVSNAIKAAIGTGLKVERVLFVGGGAAALGDLLPHYPHSSVSANPSTANARGMLKMLRVHKMRLDGNH